MSHSFHILLVEDSEADADLTADALGSIDLPSTLHIAKDGQTAMEFLRRQGRFERVPRPHLVLLDLNLPFRDGRHTLREIKSDPLLRGVPVVILTTSETEQDVITSYDLGANSYITKPIDFEEFAGVITSIAEYWFKVATLPS